MRILDREHRVEARTVNVAILISCVIGIVEERIVPASRVMVGQDVGEKLTRQFQCVRVGIVVRIKTKRVA